MKRVLCGLAFAATLCAGLSGARAEACSWAAYVNGKAAVTARTVDWYHTDNAVVIGHGRNEKIKAAATDNALEYTAKYASIHIYSFGRLVSCALNEKGLEGNILYLDGSTLPAPQPGRKDINPYEFIAYAVANFADVREVVDSLNTLNFLPAPNLLRGADGKDLADKPENWPYHFAFADASGDKAVIEFVDGKMQVYHGKEHDAMTNEPFYNVHTALEFFGYDPDGSISTIARRARAKAYLKDMHTRGVDEPARALAAMRGLLATVFAGTEEIDLDENEVFPTQWWGLADLNAGRYYITRIESWCAEVYDFSMFDPEKPEAVTLKAPECPHPPIAVKQ